MKRIVIFSFFVAIMAIYSGCIPTPTPIPEFTGKKVIASHLGEMTHDLRSVGEVIRYKVSYQNNSKQTVDIYILDKLDANLSQVTVFNNGSYDKPTHTVIWEVKNVTANQSGFVEFEAIIGKTEVIHNKALIQIGGRFDPKSVDPSAKNVIETNVVETTVCSPTRLGWIPFDAAAKEGETPRSYMKDETTMGTMINFDIPGMFAQEVKVDGVIYHRLSIPGHTTLLDIGKPELPIVGQIVEIPYGVNFTIEIFKSKSISLECYNVYPVQKRQIRQNNSKKETFELDRSTYLMNASYPENLAVIEAEDVGVIRGHRVVFLKVNPIQYNPAAREITAFSNIEVRLKYDQPAQIQPIERSIESPAFEELLQASVLNYKTPDRFARGDTRDVDDKEEGCEYLILTHGDFYNANDANNPIVRFQNWKRQKGYKTRVVDVANIAGGNTANSIRNYLQNAYKNWTPVPTYVLLVGDTGLVPTNYQTNHPDAHNNTQIGTDLHYVTVDGTDYFPDIFIGRLSVDTPAQARNVINKILAYEQNPPGNAAFYADTSLVCLFEDDDPVNGQEDASFRIIEFAEEIEDYLDTNNYNPERIYDQSGNWAPGPQRYENGTNLPPNLTIGGGFPWNGATANVTNAINTGNFIVTYNGHGSRTAWARPGFNAANINALANGALTPVVFSLACQTGWFDNETDATDLDPAPGNQGTGANEECFSETFLRHNNGGAVAIIGATRNSWDNNDFMMLGMFKAIWPDFDPNPPFGPGQLPDIEMGPLVRMGQINTFSKIYMANYYNHDNFRQASFEMYHLFGDPEMPIWTEEPARFKVEHPEGIGSTGEQDFVVNVTDDGSGNPVQSAVVVLTRNNSIIAIRQTNPGGFARFTLNALGSGELTITVTAHNYRPYEGKIEVNAGGAILNRLEPNNGTENQVIHVGGQNFSGSENVDIYFGNSNMLTKATTGGSFGQSGVENVDITVPSPYALGPVNVLAHGKTSDRYAVDVFQVRTANPIDLYTYDQWDNTTWHLHTGDNPVWNNPEIQLYDSSNNPVESNNLTAGHTYTIKAKIHNDTDFKAEHVKVTFKWANFGLGQPERVWTDIDTDDLDVPAHDVKEAEVRWAPSTGHLCILVEIYHVEDINGNNNKGQENCHVGPTSSPAKVPLLIWNPTESPAAVHLELRQLIRPDQEEEERLWGSWIQHPEPQILLPGERGEVWVIIEPDVADVKSGKRAEFALTGFINRKVIGGANFIIIKK